MINETHRIFPKLDRLIDVWCERRCLKPLCFILRDYPLCGELADGWAVLLETLLEIKGLCSHELTIDERELLMELINATKDKVRD